MKHVLLPDVTPLSPGVETMGGVRTTLIPRNTTVPFEKPKVFSSAEDGQMTVDIHVLQGERSMAADKMTLGAVLTGRDPPAPRGVPQIEVTSEVDGNGILHVTAKDLASGREHAVTIPASTNLTTQVHRAHGRRGEATRGRGLPEERGGGRPQPRRFVGLSCREGDA